jgi:hypothetical protein
MFVYNICYFSCQGEFTSATEKYFWGLSWRAFLTSAPENTEQIFTDAPVRFLNAGKTDIPD